MDKENKERTSSVLLKIYSRLCLCALLTRHLSHVAHVLSTLNINRTFWNRINVLFNHSFVVFVLLESWQNNLCFLILCVAILFWYCAVKSPLLVNLLAPLYSCHPPPLSHSPADVRQGRLVVPAVYLLPFRGFTWEATAQINSLNSHRSVGTSISLPCSLAYSLSASTSTSLWLI